MVEAALAGALDRCTFSSQDPRALHYAACGMRPHWPLLMLRGEPAKVGDPRRLADVGPAEASGFERHLTGFGRLALHDYLASRPGHEALFDGKVLAIVLEDPEWGPQLDRLLWADDVDPVDAVLGTLATVADLEHIDVFLPGPNDALSACSPPAFAWRTTTTTWRPRRASSTRHTVACTPAWPSTRPRVRFGSVRAVPIRVLVAEDNVLLRDGIRRIIESVGEPS